MTTKGLEQLGIGKRSVRKCVSKKQVYFLDLILFIAFFLIFHSPSGFLGFLKNGCRCGIYGVAICSVLPFSFGFISFPLPLFLLSSHPWKSGITQISISSSSGSETEDSESRNGDSSKVSVTQVLGSSGAGDGGEGAKGLVFKPSLLCLLSLLQNVPDAVAALADASSWPRLLLALHTVRHKMWARKGALWTRSL